MPCPTCDHTMKNLGTDASGDVTFWCVRCGTIRTAGVRPSVETPRIVSEAGKMLATVDRSFCTDEVGYAWDCLKEVVSK